MVELRDEFIRPTQVELDDSPNDLAKPIVNAIESLYSKHRRRILIELQETNSLSYSELKEKVGLGKGTFNYHLKKLSEAGMVRNFLLEQVETSFISFYEISELGKRIVDGVYNAFTPPAPKVRYSGSALSWSIEVDGEKGSQDLKEATDAAWASPPGELIQNMVKVIQR